MMTFKFSTISTTAAMIAGMVMPGAVMAQINWAAVTCGTMRGSDLIVTPEGGTDHVCAPGCSWVIPSEVSYEVKNYSPYAMEVLIQQEVTEGGSTFLELNGETGDLALSLGPWVTEVVDAEVAAESLPNGHYSTTLKFIDQTNEATLSRVHTLELGVPHLVVTPEDNLMGGGPLGGPISDTRLYRGTSEGPSPIPLRVSSSEPWVSFNGQPGPYNITVPGAGGYVNITASFNDGVGDLPAGLHTSVVTFEVLSEFGDGTTTRLVQADVARNVYPATDVPLSIPDNTLISSEITVTDDYCVADVDVDIDITHENRGDLQIVLISPMGTEVYLHNRSGEGYDDLVRTYDDDGSGFLADGPGEIHDFYPEDAVGTWTLEVRDAATDNEGVLNNWTLRIASTGEYCPPTCEDIDLVIDQDEIYDIQLLGSSYYDYDLTYIITSLPYRSTLRDSNFNVINSVPYSLPANGDTVTIIPDNNFIGADDFKYGVHDGTPSEESNVTLVIGEIPNEDSCYDAFTLANGAWDFDTMSATTDGPIHEECQFDGQTYHDIWFRYLACEDGDLIVSTCDSASYDTDLVVYNDDDCDTLEVLGCNDDDDNCAGYTSHVEVSVTMGEAYLVRVGGWNEGDQGTGVLTIDGPPGDCGDDGGDDPECPGDLDNDGFVGVNDVLLLLGAWGTPDGDVDGDGMTDVNDILALLGYYGDTC